MTLREHIVELRNRLLISGARDRGRNGRRLDLLQPGLGVPDQSRSRPASRQLAADADQAKKPSLTFTGVGNALTFRIKISALFGLVLAAPVWLYQLWAFIAPGLHRSERKWAILFSAIATPLFVAGMAVAYWTLPKGIEILIGLHPARHPEPGRAAATTWTSCSARCWSSVSRS